MPFYVIPAIDIIDGKCVRLTQGDYNQKKVYHEDPVSMAQSFEDAGFTRLHLVDLDGAKAKKIVNWRVLEEIAERTNLHIDFGGGIRTNKDIAVAFDAGARQVTGGSIAVKDPETFLGWLERYGPERIILGADAKAGKIAINGWQESTDQSLLEFLDFYRKKGISYAVCTDIEKDGMQQGASIDLYKSILKEQPSIRLIASGGVGSVKELKKLKKLGLHGAIVGKAIYEGNISLEELASV